MSIDAKIDELIGAINGLAESNRTLAQAYAKMASAPDNGPPRAPRGTGKANNTDTVTIATPPAAAPAAEPAAPAVTMTEVREAVMAIGDKEQITAFVQSYNVSKLSDIPAEKWADVIAKAAKLKADPLS